MGMSKSQMYVIDSDSNISIFVDFYLYNELQNEWATNHVRPVLDVWLRSWYFCQSTIIQLVKCKSGDLSDVNNYRATAMSNSVSKI